MCSGLEILSAVGSGLSIFKALTGGGERQQATPPAPEVKPQAAKPPDEGAMRNKNAEAVLIGPQAGNVSTLLTGPGGVDPASLTLGKNKLLGA